MDIAGGARRIYLDNAATSYPKPAKVRDSMACYMNDIGASPGRGGYESSLEAGRLVFQAREAAAQLFHASGAEQVVFTPNVTYALNFAIHGLLRRGDHVVTTSMEHNSVMRPLRS
ncbi:MAG TPA: aminotransferase class V-fold PLP-dependent enzyme, partial [Bacillota bacterium]|nr:aminotransferase class V-fold PLP-dependent enzyme [Bacillota bacterium]